LGTPNNLEILNRRSGLLIVFSGPSGVGKDTVLHGLCAVCPGVHRSVTFTTRKPRPGEQHGVDYFFVSEDEFRAMIARNEFLEHAEVHGNLYGSSLGQVREIRELGGDVLLKIDVQGGLAVKERLPDAVMIFVGPPSLDELERRLRGRESDSDSAIARRLEDAGREIEQIPRYEYLVINDRIKDAVATVHAIVMAERVRIRSYEG